MLLREKNRLAAKKESKNMKNLVAFGEQRNKVHAFLNVEVSEK